MLYWTEMPFTTIRPQRQPVGPGRERRPRRRRTIIIAAILVLLLAAILYYVGTHRAANDQSSMTLTPPASSKTKEQQSVTSANGVGDKVASDDNFNKKQYSNDDPASLWVIVNKRRPLQPKDYAPQVAAPNVPLRLGASNPEMMVSTKMVPALESMFAAAKKDGIELMVASGYRPYSLQVSVYGSEVKAYGQAEADRESARPGFSEHQTGLAVDLEPVSRQCEVQDCFGDTPEGKWVTEHAHEYGFILRYTPTGEPTTGYRHETWHFRYVGTELSKEIYRLNNPPLETFFGLPAAPDYQ